MAMEETLSQKSRKKAKKNGTPTLHGPSFIFDTDECYEDDDGEIYYQHPRIHQRSVEAKVSQGQSSTTAPLSPMAKPEMVCSGSIFDDIPRDPNKTFVADTGDGDTAELYESQGKSVSRQAKMYRKFAIAEASVRQSNTTVPLSKPARPQKMDTGGKQFDKAPKYDVFKGKPKDVPEKVAAVKPVPKTRKLYEPQAKSVSQQPKWNRKFAMAEAGVRQSNTTAPLSKPARPQKMATGGKQSGKAPKYNVFKGKPKDVLEKVAAVRAVPKTGELSESQAKSVSEQTGKYPSYAMAVANKGHSNTTAPLSETPTPQKTVSSSKESDKYDILKRKFKDVPKMAATVIAALEMADPQQAKTLVPELSLQQLGTKDTKQAYVEETSDTAMKAFYEDQIRELELQLSVKAAANATNQAKLHQMEKRLQEQEQRHEEESLCLAKAKKDNVGLMSSLTETQTLLCQKEATETDTLSNLQELETKLQKRDTLEEQSMCLAKVTEENIRLAAALTQTQGAFSEKLAAEAEILSNFQQMESKLQRQEESQKEQNVCLEKVKNENVRLLAAVNQTQRELSEMAETESEALFKLHQLEMKLQRQEAIHKGQSLCQEKLREENISLKAALSESQSELSDEAPTEAETLPRLQQMEAELQKQEVSQNEQGLCQVKPMDDNISLTASLTQTQTEPTDKAAAEAETPAKPQQTESKLQRQEPSQNEQSSRLAMETEENIRLMAALAQTQSELDAKQLQWQEEKSHLLQALANVQQTLVEETWTRWDNINGRIGNMEEQLKKGPKKNKKPSMWRRFLRLFK